MFVTLLKMNFFLSIFQEFGIAFGQFYIVV